MNFNKYHFFWIVPCAVAIAILGQFIFERKTKHDYITVKIKTRITAYDQYQLYFVPEGQQAFAEQYSVRRNILGMNGSQTILFHIPDSIPITKLRLDIGQNPEQKVIEIQEIEFVNGRKTISVLAKGLIPNAFIEKIVDAKFYSRILDNRFDPYLEFNQTAINDFNKLRNSKSFNAYLLFILSASTILSLWFANDLVRINKYSLYYVVLGLLIFTLLAFVFEKLTKNKKLTNGSTIITLDAIIRNDDILKVFLQPLNASSFTEDYALTKKVYGSEEKQKINFVFTDTIDVNKIRIDISQNIDQLPIEIFQIDVKREQKLTLVGEDIFSVFILNDFIKKDSGSTVLRTGKLENSYAQYDPFIFSTDMSAYFDDLKIGTGKRANLFPYLISLLFTSVFVYYLIFNTSADVTEHKIFEYGFSFFFLLVLILPTIGNLLGFELNMESIEKRKLAEKPKFKVSEIEKYPRSFEGYYNDNFGFRNLLIQLGANIKINIFKASPAPDKVTIGRDNWIFLSGRSYGVTQDLKRENLFTSDQLQKKITTWLGRRDTLKSMSIQSYIALWPDKHNVYTQYLPLSMKVQLKDTISKTDQMIIGLKKADSFSEIIDVRVELIEKQKTVQVFLKNDTHWNEYGAFIAYQKLMQKISKNFPQVLPIKEATDYKIEWTESSDGDLLNIMGIERTDHFIDKVPNFISLDEEEDISSLPTDSYPAETIFHRNMRSPNNLRVIIFRDSFTRSLTKFISPHFKEVLYIWTPFDQRIVDSYKPDIVIECFVERYFD